MKALLVSISAIVLLIVIVISIGYMLPEEHIVSRSASFHASPDQLYRLIAGPQNWRPDLARAEEIASPDGRVYVRETSRGGEAITYEISGQQSPYAIERRIATQNLPYTGEWHYSIRPNGDSTIVRITEKGSVFNPVFRFVSRFVMGQTSTMDDYLRALGKAAGAISPVTITD